ncbi:MAG: MraY family glycosyltransferase, partial [Flavobacteriales bacterium]
MNTEYLLLVLFLVFLFSLVFSVLTNVILLRFARTLGVRDQKELQSVRWSSTVKPSLGGITFFISFLVSISIYAIFFNGNDVLKTAGAAGMLLSLSLAFLMGLADDAYNTKPFLKFGVQLTCAGILIITGHYISITPYEWLNYVLTVLWVVGIMNSINMLDNMDAITGTVSVTIIISLLVSIRVNNFNSVMDMVVLCGVCGSLFGFLFHNWHPSVIFMGDTGSQFLGMLLAFFGIKYFWNAPDSFGQVIQGKQFCSVLMAFVIPLVDTIFVVVSRIARKQSPFIGGKDHTTHYLSYLGLSDSQVAFLFGGLGLFSSFLVALISHYIFSWNNVYTLVFLLYFVLLIVLIFIIKWMLGQHVNKKINTNDYPVCRGIFGVNG